VQPVIDTALDRPDARVDRRVAPRRTRARRTLVAYAVLLPALLVIGVFAYYPALTGIFFSFFDWRPGFTSEFLGLANYERMLTDKVWWDSFANLGIIFVFGIVTWIVPFIAAELVVSLSRERLRFVFRTLLIAPIAFPQMVILLVWGFFYDPANGVINSFLRGIGLEALAQNWLGDPATALGALLFIGFPWIAGIPFLIFLTGLQNIPREVFDAAALDGVGRVRRVFSIDLPMMANQLALLSFLAVISTLQYGMAAFILTGGGPDNATQVPILRMLSAAFNGGDWGYAATLSTTLFLVTVAFGLIVLLSRSVGKGTRARA
jgi:ABC-type sugar transport system permease subunit